MLSDFGSLGIADQAGAVLEGRYETPSCLPKWMDTYVNALQMAPQIRRKGLILDTVSTDNHCRYWRRSMETTALEPRGLHNGHYKAVAESELVSQFDAAFCATFRIIRDTRSRHGAMLRIWLLKKPAACFSLTKCVQFSLWQQNTTQIINNSDAIWCTTRKVVKCYQRSTGET
jgi:hypothetical protein